MTNMVSKQFSPSSHEPPTTGARRGAPAGRSESARSSSVVKLSLDVGPLVSIIQRHVKLSKKARAAIVHDLAEVLVHTDVQLEGESANPRSAAVSAVDPVLTTEEAARLVGVSRPFIAKLIDSGEIELHQKVGNQRRVLRSAVTRWQKDERARQTRSLKHLSEDLDAEIFPS